MESIHVTIQNSKYIIEDYSVVYSNAEIFLQSRSQQPPEVFWKKGVLKKLSNFTEKYLCWILASIKFQAFRSATLLKKLRHRCFSVNIAKFLKHFHSPTLPIYQMKVYKERNNFIPRTIFWKCLVPLSKGVWKVHHKNWTL